MLQNAAKPGAPTDGPNDGAPGGPTVAEKADRPRAGEAPLAPGEVGGSNRMTEPQIVDVTGRGTPNGDKTANKIPNNASGINPDNTPVQGKQAPTKEPSARERYR